MAYGYNSDPVGGAINTGLNVFSAINGYYQQQHNNERQARLDAQAAEDRARRMEREDFTFDELKATKAREEAGRELAPVKLWLQQQKALPSDQRQVMPPEFLEKLRKYDPPADNYLKNPLAVARAQQALLDPELVKQAGAGVAEAQETLKSALTTYLGPRLGGGRVVNLQALEGGKIMAEGEFPSIPAKTRDGKPAVDEQGNQIYLTRGGQPTPGPTYIAPLTMGGDPGPDAQVAMPTVQQLYAKLMDEHDTLNILNNAIAAHDPKYYEQLMEEAKTAESRKYTESQEGVKHGRAIELKDIENKAAKERNDADNKARAEENKLNRQTQREIAAMADRRARTEAQIRRQERTEDKIDTYTTAISRARESLRKGTTAVPDPYNAGKYIEREMDPSVRAGLEDDIAIYEQRRNELMGVKPKAIPTAPPKASTGRGAAFASKYK